MRFQLRNVLVLCLALLVVVVRVPTSHASHGLVTSFQQTHCDHANGAPKSDNPDCSDLCPLCQSPLKGSAILSAVPSVAQRERSPIGLTGRAETTDFAAQPMSRWQYARAPPHTD